MSLLSDSHALRRFAGVTTGRLLARVGVRQVHEVEDCVQDALVRALETWPYNGVPEDPSAWLTRVAWHRWVDRHRRYETEARAIAELTVVDANTTPDGHETVLALFVGASENVPPTARIPLTLRLACGLGSMEIANLLDLAPATVEKRLTRGRSALTRIAHAETVVSVSALPTVLETLAAFFTAGVEALPEGGAMAAARAAEALHLIDEVLAHPQLGDVPVAWACAAWMRLTAARLPARTDDRERVSLRRQDRSRWSGILMRLGFEALGRATGASTLSVWHLMAGISALHAEAPNWESTNWARVRALYEDLVRIRGQLGDSLGLGVAIWQTDGPDAARTWLLSRSLKTGPYHALMAELCEDSGIAPGAHWRAAIDESRSDADRVYYARRAQAAVGRFDRRASGPD